MRRVLRKIARGETDFGDISTLADPTVVEVLQQGREELMKPKNGNWIMTLRATFTRHFDCSYQAIE